MSSSTNRIDHQSFQSGSGNPFGFDYSRRSLTASTRRNIVVIIDVVAKEKIDEIGFVTKSVSVAVTFLEYPFLI